MARRFARFIPVCLAMLLAAFAGAALADDDQLSRGAYLTRILGCGQCHTEGALIGNPYGAYLAGSRIGIAYTDDGPDAPPGIAFAGNLTPHRKHGIGRWKASEIITLLKQGLKHDGERALTVMPWPNYSTLYDEDVAAIAAYLLSLKPVASQIPENVAPGTRSEEPYVRIGVFTADPAGKLPALQRSQGR